MLYLSCSVCYLPAPCGTSSALCGIIHCPVWYNTLPCVVLYTALCGIYPALCGIYPRSVWYLPCPVWYLPYSVQYLPCCVVFTCPVWYLPCCVVFTLLCVVFTLLYGIYPVLCGIYPVLCSIYPSVPRSVSHLRNYSRSQAEEVRFRPSCENSRLRPQTASLA